jgi:hypothetical protein
MNDEFGRIWKEEVGTVKAFAWRDWDKPRKPSVMISNVLTKIPTKNLLDRSLQQYR